MPGVAHNLLVVADEHGFVYGFDADSGVKLWQRSTPKAGETVSDDRGCSQVSPEIGITSTPVVVRPTGANPIIYVVAMSKDGSGNYHQRLHALDATTGKELSKSPVEIQAKFKGTGDNSSGGNVIFDPGQYKERPGLLWINGTVYLAFSSHCDIRPYTGWIMGYNGTTLAQTTVLNVTPNGNAGAVWNSGAGMAADNSGNIFLLDANGLFDTTLKSGFPSQGDYGNAFLKLSTTPGLAVADYFEMYNQQDENDHDIDLGSGGALLVSLNDTAGKTWNLAVGAGKDENLYVVNRANMGKFNSSTNQIYPATLRSPARRHLVGARLFFWQALLRARRFSAARLPIQERKTDGGAGSEDGSLVRLSRSYTQHLGQRNRQWHRLGRRTRQPRCAPRLQRSKSA